MIPFNRFAYAGSAALSSRQPRLIEYFVFSLLLHILIVLLFGTQTGDGQSRGQKLFGSLNVTLNNRLNGLLSGDAQTDTAPDIKDRPILQRNSQRSQVTAPVAPTGQTVTDIPPLRDHSPSLPAPAVTEAPVSEPVPVTEIAPEMPKQIGKPVTRLIAPSPAIETPPVQPVPPSVDSKPQEKPAAPAPPYPELMVSPKIEHFKVPPPVATKPEAAPVLQPPALERPTPVTPEPPVPLPVPAIPPAAPAPPAPPEPPTSATRMEPVPAPQPETRPPVPKALPAEVPPDIPVIPPPRRERVVPRPIEQAVVPPPVDIKPKVLPALPPSLLQSINPPAVSTISSPAVNPVTQTAQPPVPAASAPAIEQTSRELAPAPTVASPAERGSPASSATAGTAGQSAQPQGKPEPLAHPGNAAGTSSESGLDLETLRNQARNLGRQGTGAGRSGVFQLQPPPVLEEHKSKLAKALDKAAKSDCREAYAGMGLAAVVPLAASPFRDSGCKW